MKPTSVRPQGWVRRLVAAVRRDRKKIGIYLAIAYVLFYVVADPVAAAGLVRDALNGVGDAAGRVAEFFRAILTGGTR
jgi:hypothetical protein